MEASKKNTEKSCSSPELAAIASKAIEQALARHKLSQAQLEDLCSEPQPIFDFFENLLSEEEKKMVPDFKIYPDKQFFVIEALSGKCLKVNHAKLVSNSYKPRNFALEAAACFSGDSPATPETKVRAHRISGKASILEVAQAVSEDVKNLILTRAQIRRFCSNHADIILLKKMIPIFLFDRCELISDCKEGLMAVTAYIDSRSMHFNIATPDNLVKNGEGEPYLVTPFKMSDHDQFMIEAMETYTGI